MEVVLLNIFANDLDWVMKHNLIKPADDAKVWREQPIGLKAWLTFRRSETDWMNYPKGIL